MIKYLEEIIISEVSLNKKEIATHTYVHPVKPELLSTEIKPLIKLQPVILPPNDIMIQL